MFYSIKKQIAYCNATHLPGWRWRQCFTLQKNELFTAVQLTCQVKDADTVFYSLKKKRIVYPNTTQNAMLKMEAQCFTLQKHGLFTATQLTCQVDKGDLTVSSAWIQRLPWLPDTLKMVLVMWPPCRRYRWKLPIVLPYMWYQKRRQAPAVEGCEGLISWAFWPWWRADASTYM